MAWRVHEGIQRIKALDEGIFKSQLGGIKRANKLFETPITDVLAEFNKTL